MKEWLQSSRARSRLVSSDDSDMNRPFFFFFCPESPRSNGKSNCAPVIDAEMNGGTINFPISRIVFDNPISPLYHSIFRENDSKTEGWETDSSTSIRTDSITPKTSVFVHFPDGQSGVFFKGKTTREGEQDKSDKKGMLVLSVKHYKRKSQRGEKYTDVYADAELWPLTCVPVNVYITEFVSAA